MLTLSRSSLLSPPLSKEEEEGITGLFLSNTSTSSVPDEEVVMDDFEAAATLMAIINSASSSVSSRSERFNSLEATDVLSSEPEVFAMECEGFLLTTPRQDLKIARHV